MNDPERLARLVGTLRREADAWVDVEQPTSRRAPLARPATVVWFGHSLPDGRHQGVSGFRVSFVDDEYGTVEYAVTITETRP